MNARDVLKHNFTFRHERGVGAVEGKERKKNPFLNQEGLTSSDGVCNVCNGGKRSVK